MSFNKREYFKNIANETINIISSGYYINSLNEKVDIKKLIDKAVKGTEVISDYRKDVIKEQKVKYNQNFSRLSSKSFKVITNNTTINTIIELRKCGIDGNIIALNFASAKNPGGGFQIGSNAQEESITRASAIYPCLIKHMEFYEFHRKQRNPIYSDRMIYSPDVPVFRDDSGKFLSKPILCSFISSPAVNAKAATERGINYKKINEIMNGRINCILKLALSKEPEAIILGAFGCGVFGNKPEDIASIFATQLIKLMNEIRRIKIVFAIYDKNEKIINIFKHELKDFMIFPSLTEKI